MDSFSVVCPCCLEALDVPKDRLSKPVYRSDGKAGWFFVCGKCNHHWWCDKDDIPSNLSFDEQTAMVRQAEQDKPNIEHLKKIFEQFEDFQPPKLSKLEKPQMDKLSQTTSENDVDHCGFESVKDNIITEIKSEIDRYAADKMKTIQSFERKKTWFNRSEKKGFDFFPKKATAKVQEDQKDPKDPGYSYKRALPQYPFVPDSISKKTAFFPKFFYGKKREIVHQESLPTVKADFEFQNPSPLISPITDFVAPKTKKSVKNSIRSNFVARMHKHPPYIAMQEEEKIKVLPFPQKESAENDARLSENRAPVPSILSLDPLPDEGPHTSKSSKSYRLFFFVLWGLVVISTLCVLWLTKKYEDRGLSLWKSSSYSSMRQSALKIEKVSYAFVGPKIIVTGEIINEEDDSFPAAPISFRAYGKQNRLIMSWEYFPPFYRVLPHEHVLFRSEKEFPLALRCEGLRVEVAFANSQFSR